MSKLESPLIPKMKSRQTFTRDDVSASERFELPAIGYNVKRGWREPSREITEDLSDQWQTLGTPPFEDLNIGVKTARIETW